jgi:predicted N-formylglutamate amidohydrolase
MRQASAEGAFAATEPLLASDEPPPADWREGASDPFLLVCEHASNRVPRSLGDLGLPPEAFERHIAWDPGAARLTLGLAGRLGAEAVLQRYSRLVIDCNREPHLADAITPFSEDTAIPGNRDLDEEARQARIASIWAPFHSLIERRLSERIAARRPTVLVTLHSFTPVYRGRERPWHIGIISTTDRRMAEPMLEALRRDGDLVVGDDQPYSARDHVDYTIRRHGRERGLPGVMIEVRNDLLRTEGDVAAWADRLAGALVESVARIGMDAGRRTAGPR